ncbi:hypothetical protein [Dyella humicola]|uniref:hypothetical protein n=1 Tax=Dyella humicola TaxID=2992126 RepID=UPI00224D8132|nr:hypothetical protein [Dyella humicola]
MRRPWEWLLGLMLVAAPLLAQDVPPALRDWKDWVLHDVPQHACPLLATPDADANVGTCAWPGRLVLDVDKDGAHFSLGVHVDAESWVGLPGDARNWPQQVSVDNKPWPVLDREENPALHLAAGDYVIRGVLPWDSRPARLRVPESIGLVSLTLDGKVVNRVERHADQVTLGEAAAAQRVVDALSLRVYRHLADGLPSRLETQLQFDVTGSSRELLFGPALPRNFMATSLQGELPARLESDGRLRVQLRPGHWTLTLGARGTEVLEHITLSLPAGPWPRQEIWSYADDTSLRSTRVQGQATDAAQADVPGEWQNLPAYVLDGSSGLSIEQGTRGGEGGQGDQLTLHRQLWLDFDGRGYNAADHLTGTLRRHQRLDVTAPWQLQSAVQDGTPLLITANRDGHGGVELRYTSVNLKAGLRLPERGAMPSTGWQLPLESIDATLHLPYGYRLLGAAGADRSPDSWIAQWSLLDLFVVALIGLLAGRLLGWPWALVAVGFLALSQHESGAPRWTLAVALALALLMRALPDGRLRVISRITAAALLALAVLWTLPFAAREMSYALHPQLEGRSVAGGQVLETRYVQPEAYANQEEQDRLAASNAPESAPAPMAMMQPAPPPPPAPPAPVAEISAGKTAPSMVLKSVTVTGTRLTASMTVGQETDAHSVIQAGRGAPRWDVGNNYRLGWSGPVMAEQSTRLVIAPAWLVRLLRVAMLALLLLLLGRLSLGLLRPWLGPWRGWSVRGAAVALLALALLPHAAQAQDTPSDAVLTQLRTRLTEAPTCAPDCAAVARAEVQASGDSVVLDLDMHAGATVAVPLPQADASLQLSGVSTDGHDAILTQQADVLLVKLERGVHRVSLRYRAAPVDTASLHFALRPQRLEFSGEGWAADGVDDHRLLGDSLSLNRVRAGSDGKPQEAAVQAFPPYVRLTRTLVLGVDWSVENTVERIAPSDGGFSLDLPLLPGEHPLGDNIRVHDGRIGVTFNAGQDLVRWSSRLDTSDSLGLTAPALNDRAEAWVLQAAPIWHLEAKGVPANLSDDGLRYLPLPGESLQVAIHRPQAMAGDSLAFDEVTVRSHSADRATETLLVLAARSTRGGEHLIGLPPGAELLEARRDASLMSLAIRDGKLSLPLLPGSHRYSLRLREPQGVAVRTRTPTFSLDAPAANISLQQSLPEDRWVLWTWGPAAGPAVMYWSQLIVLLLAAWLLSRHAPTPLRFHQWLLLGLGFSAFAWGAYALVVVWLILLGLRARHVVPEPYATRFNLLQAGLALMTVAALVVLVSAVPKGLLGLPDMHVAGNASSAWQLNWFADQSRGVLPHAGVFSVSLWFYKIAMLLWALWLANALIGWLRWGFEAWTKGGYWRPRKPKAIEPPPVPVPAE